MTLVCPDEQTHGLIRVYIQTIVCMASNDGVYSFRAQTDKRHPVDPGTSYTVIPRGVADLYA